MGLRITPRQRLILEYLAKHDRWIGPKEVGINALGYPEKKASGNTRGAMLSLWRRGYLKTDWTGRYKLKWQH